MFLAESFQFQFIVLYEFIGTDKEVRLFKMNCALKSRIFPKGTSEQGKKAHTMKKHTNIFMKRRQNHCTVGLTLFRKRIQFLAIVYSSVG